MERRKLTQKVVNAAVPQSGDYFLWDPELRGFGLKVTRGGRKVYVVQYRMGGRGFPTKRRTIGVEGSPWTPSTARSEAGRLLHMVGLGHDPALVDREAEREQLHGRFEQLTEHFLEAYGKLSWAPGTYSNRKSDIQRWVIPVLGKKSLSSISRRDITAVMDRIPSGRPALPRNVFVLMRTIFNWALGRGDLDKSPMLGMKAPRAAPERHHILADDELVVVAATAPKLGPVWGNMVHMLILTGQRLGEVANMEWSELDRAGRLWQIPRNRTKNSRDHVVPLNQAAVATLDALAGLVSGSDVATTWPRSGFVFSHVPGKPVSGFSKVKARLDRMVAATTEPQVRPWRLHDLRRTVATNMQRLGVRFEVTEAILNHVSITQAGVASVYQRHDWLDEKRAALDAWGGKLLSIVESYEAARWPKPKQAKALAKGD
jgi:integrase